MSNTYYITHGTRQDSNNLYPWSGEGPQIPCKYVYAIHNTSGTSAVYSCDVDNEDYRDDEKMECEFWVDVESDMKELWRKLGGYDSLQTKLDIATQALEEIKECNGYTEPGIAAKALKKIKEVDNDM